MWRVVYTDQYRTRMKRYAKKHGRELEAMLENLRTYTVTLESGAKPLQIRHGFLHSETHGAIAIDQRGTVGKASQHRLYLYPDATTETLYLITIGDKSSQRDDNAVCRELILALRESEPNEQDAE